MSCYLYVRRPSCLTEERPTQVTRGPGILTIGHSNLLPHSYHSPPRARRRDGRGRPQCRGEPFAPVVRLQQPSEVARRRGDRLRLPGRSPGRATEIAVPVPAERQAGLRPVSAYPDLPLGHRRPPRARQSAARRAEVPRRGLPTLSPTDASRSDAARAGRDARSHTARWLARAGPAGAADALRPAVLRRDRSLHESRLDVGHAVGGCANDDEPDWTTARRHATTLVADPPPRRSQALQLRRSSDSVIRFIRLSISVAGAAPTSVEEFPRVTRPAFARRERMPYTTRSESQLNDTKAANERSRSRARDREGGHVWKPSRGM